MHYQLFEYSEKRRSKYPKQKKYVLVFSESEKTFNLAIKRLRKVDLHIKELTPVQEIQPKIDADDCNLCAGSQHDMETFYKS